MAVFRTDQQGVIGMCQRCEWVSGQDALYVRYHDEEWGVPKYDDAMLFEMLILEGAQAGLSWYTVLKKRENYRRLFDNFDVEKIARYSARKLESLLQDPGIIRNRLKVNSAVINAKAFLQVQKEEGSFSEYIWRYVEGKPQINAWATLKDVPVTTLVSDTMSKDLKKKGFKFFGSTICYAYMQSVGMVNDHTLDCFRHGML